MNVNKKEMRMEANRRSAALSRKRRQEENCAMRQKIRALDEEVYLLTEQLKAELSNVFTLKRENEELRLRLSYSNSTANLHDDTMREIFELLDGEQLDGEQLDGFDWNSTSERTAATSRRVLHCLQTERQLEICSHQR